MRDQHRDIVVQKVCSGAVKGSVRVKGGQLVGVGELHGLEEGLRTREAVHLLTEEPGPVAHHAHVHRHGGLFGAYIQEGISFTGTATGTAANRKQTKKNILEVT